MLRFLKRQTLLALLLLLSATNIQAQEFIGCRTERGWAESPMLSQYFHVDAGELQQTSLHKVSYSVTIASLGYHEVYVNGMKVGDKVMQPAVSQLDKHAFWVKYDITPYLREGHNQIMLWLGQGWGRIYGTPAVAKAVVEETVSDGECGLIYEILKTDSTWMARPSPYSYTGSWQPMQFGGERYDARISGRNATRAKVYDAQDIVISWQEFEGNRITDTIKPQSIERLADGSVLLDFGRVVTGWFDIVFEKVPFGQEVTMEYLDHREARPPFTETDTYIGGGGIDHFTNRFHTHAFRYVRIRHTPSPLRGTPPNLGEESEWNQGTPTDFDGEQTAAASSPSKLEGVAEGLGRMWASALQIGAVSSKEGATFECSDPRLNAIHDMVKYTLSCLTFSGYMVDCPHIERMGYGGDGNSSTNTLQTLWDVRSTYANWLQAWSDAMDSTGDLPYVAPAFRTGGGPYWQGFIVKAPWRTYLNYGDRTLIYRHYDKMKRWLEFVERNIHTSSPLRGTPPKLRGELESNQGTPSGVELDGLLKPWPDTKRRAWFLGDWAVPEGVDKGGESILHVNNCFLAECLTDMVQMARMTGHPEDAKHYAEWRQELVAAIHRHFYHCDTIQMDVQQSRLKAGRMPALRHYYANGTPLDQCYALLMGISPDSATAAAVKAQLLKDCHGKYRDHIAAGLMGVPVFTEWCIKERQTDLMATILRQEDYPGYLNMMDKECVNALVRQCVNSDAAATNTLTHSRNNALTNTLTQSHNNAFTTWESWDCGRPGKEDRSRVHNCYNGIGIWFYQALAGIRPDPEQPGYKHFFIDPQPCPGVDWVKCTKPTLYGDIKVEIRSGKLIVVVPYGTTATVFPSTPRERTVEGGNWEFTIE